MKAISFAGKLQNLHEGLRYFGLDPSDWQLREINDQALLIQNVIDPELSLLGYVNFFGHRWDWKEIKLAAI